MAKYNSRSVTALKTRGTGYIESSSEAGKTFEGEIGYGRTPKSELFLLGVSSFVEDGFYQKASKTRSRIADLSSKVVIEDYEWVLGFVTWLRAEANMRSVSIAIAMDATKALLDAKRPGGRQLVAASMLRADEPGEAVAYWQTTYGRKIPQPVKRGIADAAKKLYTERSLFKYDTDSHAIRFADVIQLTHPEPSSPKQSMLFKFALDRRYDSKAKAPAELFVAKNRDAVKAMSGKELRDLANSGKLTDYLRNSGMTWEALSGQIEGGMDAKAWEAVIPLMGYMALLRNLRNFLDAGVSQRVLDSIAMKIADPNEVAKSRQLPFRFWSAYKTTSHSNVFKLALDRALDASLSNVPSLKGKWLILVDNSGSMGQPMSGKSSIDASEAAKLFGSALALRAEKATLVEFGGGSWGGGSSKVITFRKGASVLETVGKFAQAGGGTWLRSAITSHYDSSYDGVILISDEQITSEGGNPYAVINKATPVFIWNLGGYKYGSHGNSPEGPNIQVSGGLSDASFGYIDLVYRGLRADWPWL